MDVSLGLGIFLLGAGVGALVTAIAYAGRVRTIREEIEALARDLNRKDAA
jgi:uncharacterized integral membrane protein